MKILIVGCGYLGTRLAERFSDEERHGVWGLRRDWGSKRGRPNKITADLSDPSSLKNLPPADFVIFCQAPSRESDTYRGMYVDGTKNLLVALEGSPKMIFISSTSVYGQSDGSWVDESTDPAAADYESGKAAENAAILLEAEELVRAKGGVVLRFGGIYGPGRSRVELLREGKVKPIFSKAFVNRIHVEDAVTAVRLLMEKGAPGEIYLGVDDDPATQGEFYGWLLGKLNLQAPPLEGGKMQKAARLSNKRCSNKKLKELGFKLKYPTFREGYTPLLAESNLSPGPGPRTWSAC